MPIGRYWRPALVLNQNGSLAGGAGLDHRADGADGGSMKRKSQPEIELEERLSELYERLANPILNMSNQLNMGNDVRVQIEQVKFELSRFDARRDARRVSTREWANFALTVLSVAAAILIAIFKKGS